MTVCEKCISYHDRTWLTLPSCNEESPFYPAKHIDDCPSFIPNEDLMTELEETEMRIFHQKQIYCELEESLEHSVERLAELEAKRDALRDMEREDE